MRTLAAVALVSSLATFPSEARAARASERRQVDEFDSVAVSAGIRAQVSIGARSVEVEADDDDVVAKVKTEVRGGKLVIGWKRSLAWGSHTTGAVLVRVATPSLAEVDASGGGHADVDSFTARAASAHASGGGSVVVKSGAGPGVLRLQASGGGTVRAAGVEAQQLEVGGSGGAVLEVAGRAADVALDFSGGTVIKAEGLQAQRLAVQGSGGGEARVAGADDVRGSVSGGATLHLGGHHPRAKVRTSGGGEVVYADGRRERRKRAWHEEDDDED